GDRQRIALARPRLPGHGRAGSRDPMVAAGGSRSGPPVPRGPAPSHLGSHRLTMADDRAGPREARSLRLFVGFDVARDVAEAVERAIEPWTGEFPRVRWVPRENWHVTLTFLGQTWPRLEGWVHERVDEVARAHRPIASRLTR